MSIRRGKRPDTRFYTLNKDISEDTRLSWSARGLLIFLLGKPDNWTVSVAHLIKQTADSARPSSRDAVRNIIAELVAAGYMKADTARAENGKFRGMDYVVSESPETENPSPDNQQQPEPEKPSPDEPLPGNPPLINNDHHQGLKEPTKNDIAASHDSAAGNGVLVGEVLPSEQHEGHYGNKEPSYEKIRTVFWERFDLAFSQRYGGAVLPRNKKVNSLVKELISRLGKEAPAVAVFYVTSVNEQRAVMSQHSLEVLVKNAEGYRTQWFNGRAMTAGRARQIDSTQTNASVADEAIRILRERNAQGGTQ